MTMKIMVTDVDDSDENWLTNSSCQPAYTRKNGASRSCRLFPVHNCRFREGRADARMNANPVSWDATAQFRWNGVV